MGGSLAVVFLLFRSGGHLLPEHTLGGQTFEATSELPTEGPLPDVPPAASGNAVRLTAAGDDSRSIARGSVSNSEFPSRDPQATGSATPPPQPAALPTPDPVPQAEVWSYPPLLQQSASNNFVRAMANLANAKTEIDRYLALGSAAKSEFVFGGIEKARSYGLELLSLDAGFKEEIWRDGNAVYDANLVLGRVAAQEGRITEAKQYLLEAGKSTGSPVLGSFGPNMSLARDLLQSGGRDEVLEFFDRCRKFWPDPKLTLWSEDVRAGRMPDFGANLYY